MSSLTHHFLCRVFLVKHQIRQVTQPLNSPDLVACDFWLFLKLKSSFKGKKFETVSEIQDLMVQLMATGRTVSGPRVPTLKGSEVSLSYVQCFLYLVFSSINVSIFHFTFHYLLFITFHHYCFVLHSSFSFFFYSSTLFSSFHILYYSFFI